ncbi:RagB/SusD family nutrient uptake outer membrane protein [Spirosoma sp.]|uniref:RagB/SusD family nutrient uptake outer membrane protein n=1 Tax=Spirosoma sp. TaxID=1899569 RepID=UPI002611039F|nr:RagB/SusD family nutrient uptake outer membrane protein [Spirosoma sp.]MCX6213081.1 RagB/SusD family nutrient uptake outer membrane protein [Spirosoma sp.]
MKKILTCLLVLTLSSCSDLLEEVPQDTLVTSIFFRTQSDALAGMNAVYGRLNKNMYNRIFYLYTDEFTDDGAAGIGVNNANIRAIDNFTHTPVNDRIDLAWQEHYDGVNRANEVITKVPLIAMDTQLRDRIVGEAKFIRALLYFNLVRLFGPVPLVLTPTASAEGIDVEQASVEAVYTQILKDLTEAEAVLPLTYSGGDVGRASKGAAKGLLAKVYLTRQQWSLAAQKCKEIIDSKTYELWDDYAKVFQVGTENQKEVLFSVQFASGVSNGNSMMVLSMPRGKVPGLTGNEADVPTDDLVAAYEAGDRRKEVTIRNSLAVGSQTYTFTNCFFKYYDPATFGNSADSGVNYPILRYSDVLLMYAEALNEQTGPTPEAYALVNQVRQRARNGKTGILPDLTGLTKETLRTAILKERRVEMAFEGQRWFDLIRTGTMIATMKAHGKTNVQPYHVLLPIPQREMDTNKKLKQNTGY